MGRDSGLHGLSRHVIDRMAVVIEGELVGHVYGCAGKWWKSAGDVDRSVTASLGLKLQFIVLLRGDGQNPVFDQIRNVIGALEFKLTGPGPASNFSKEVLCFLDGNKLRDLDSVLDKTGCGIIPRLE